MGSLIQRPERIFKIKNVERPDNIPALIDYEAIRQQKERENFNKVVKKEPPKESNRRKKEKEIVRKQKVKIPTTKELTEQKLQDNRQINQNARDQASYYFSQAPTPENLVKGAYYWTKGNIFTAPEKGNPHMNTGTPPIVGTVPINLPTLITSTAGGIVGGDLGEEYLGGESGREVGNIIGTIGGAGIGNIGTKVWKWGNTKYVIEGTEATVRSKPFSPYVEKVVYDPEYQELKNSIPAKRLLKSKLIGYENGHPVYRQLKVIPSKKVSKEFRRGLAKDDFYPAKFDGYDETFAYNPNLKEKYFIGDFDENTGWFPWMPGRQYAYDWSASTAKDIRFLTSNKKYGGKLIFKFKKGGLIPKFQKSGKIYSNYSDAKDRQTLFPDFIIKGIDWINHKTGWNIPKGASNCTLTATQWIDPRFPLLNSRTIIDNGEDWGYNEVSEDEAIAGDLVIARNLKEDANHTMLLSEQVKTPYSHEFYGKQYNMNPGDWIVEYSNGSTDPSSYRKVGLKEYIDNSSEKEDSKKTDLKYYRYVSPEQGLETILPEVIVTPDKVYMDTSRARVLKNNKRK